MKAEICRLFLPESKTQAGDDWNDGRMRTLYVLNIDHWSGRPAASAQFLFGTGNYTVGARTGTIEVITASKSVAVMPECADVDVLEIEELPGKFRVVVQSDAGAVLRVFAPNQTQCPKKIRTSAGGVQEIEIRI